jgi:hypothetical protein
LNKCQKVTGFPVEHYISKWREFTTGSTEISGGSHGGRMCSAKKRLVLVLNLEMGRTDPTKTSIQLSFHAEWIHFVI